jgi:hypothetical protein
MNGLADLELRATTSGAASMDLAERQMASRWIRSEPCLR